MGKLPAIWLYPGDWLQDEIAGCSLAAQGLLLRMMFLGHSSTRYGYLVNSDGAAIPPESIARRCGCAPEQYATLLTELDSVGKLNRTPEGLIFIKRMVRDAASREQGKKRVEKHRLKRSCNADVTPNEDEIEVDSGLALKKEPFKIPVWVPEKAFAAWLEMRNTAKPKLTDEGKKRLVMKLEGFKEKGLNIEQIIWESVMNGWKSFYEPKDSASQPGSRGYDYSAANCTQCGKGFKRTGDEQFCSDECESENRKVLEWLARKK